MQSPVAVLTDKVMSTVESMVYLAMRVSYRRGATVDEISGFLDDWIPAQGSYPQSTVERVLEDLHRDGKVAYAGARWYPTGLA